MKAILRYGAYDNKSSCLLLDTNTIADLENYISDVREEVIAGLDCCYAQTYKNQSRFRFLPGHKTCILSMPNQIKSMDATKKKKSKPMLEFKKLLTPAELKKILLTSLNRSVVKLGVEKDAYDEIHLGDVQSIVIDNDFTSKCTVQCFMCNIAINALYKGSWSTSNILRHLKEKHLKIGTSNEIQGTGEPNGTNFIECK